jgi:16S rRNA (guanine527-N7)-methyltransferase
MSVSLLSAGAARDRFAADARRLGVELDAAALERFDRLLGELGRWNRAYNLTAIDAPARQVTHHLLDSLSVAGALHGRRVADAGTGAGFPGLPLAIAWPAREFVLIDSNSKKVRFVAHAIRELGLDNASAVQARLDGAPLGTPFDCVVSRAFASLAGFAASAGGLLAPGGRLLAMKGRRPDAELAALAPPWRALEVRRLEVPGLDEERHLAILARD